MYTLPLWIGGQFIKTDQVLEVRNPYHKEIVGQTYLATSEELEMAIVSAQKAFNLTKKLPSYKKYTILMHIASLTEKNREEIAWILSGEACKPLKLAYGEVDRAIQVFRVAAEEARRMSGEFIKLDWTPPGEGKKGIVQWFPKGLIAGISPFNFPLNLAVHKIAPAIAAGCPIVLKPSRNTPLSMLYLAKLMAETDLPAGAVSVIVTNRETGQKLITDDRFSVLSFTGSAEVGWKMKNQAGKKKVILELGGNAGAIVTPTAELKKAIPKLVQGAFAYAGQICIHTQRIYVHESIFEDFLSAFIEATKQLRVGPPQSPETDFTAMIDEENTQRVLAWIHEAIEGGSKLLYGGKVHDGILLPTVLTNTLQEMKVCSLEVFGPVVAIEPYSQFEEALAMVNNSKYGLQAGVFTNDWREINMAFEELEVGGVIINDVPTFRVDHMPYGGMKESGLGREGIRYTMESYMERKLLVL